MGLKKNFKVFLCFIEFLKTIVICTFFFANPLHSISVNFYVQVWYQQGYDFKKPIFLMICKLWKIHLYSTRQFFGEPSLTRNFTANENCQVESA
jgi:hypothetical protein